MCFGGGSQPAPPSIQYVGPSEDSIRRSEEGLAAFQAQMLKQQEQSAAALEAQIKRMNARTAEIQKEFDAEFASAASGVNAANSAAAEAERAAIQAKRDAAAAANSTYTPVGAYDVVTSVTETPYQTTEEIKPKKKSKGALKISPTANISQAGSGLNIGV